MCPTLTLVDVIITTDHRIVGMKQISLVKVFLPPFIAWFRLAAARRRPRSIGPSALSAVHGTAACLSFQNEQRGEPSTKDIRKIFMICRQLGQIYLKMFTVPTSQATQCGRL